MVEGQTIGAVDRGIVVFVGVGHDDNTAHSSMLARKVAHLRLFPDAAGVANLSLIDTGFGALVISQFTLHADTRKGNRPSYAGAAPSEMAEEIFDHFVGEMIALLGNGNVATGRFGAMMDVAFVNEGPFTLLLESKL